jgi:hypothetical protein
LTSPSKGTVLVVHALDFLVFEGEGASQETAGFEVFSHRGMHEVITIMALGVRCQLKHQKW